jgi:hypothetical protein
MTLGELRAELVKLKHLPDATVVVLAANPEGLHFSPAGLMHEGWYVGDDRSGEVYLTEDLRQGMDDPQEFPAVPIEVGAVSAVCLYPKN